MHKFNIMIKCGLIVLVLADGRRVAGNSPYQPRHVAEGPPFVDSHPPRPEFDPSMASHVTSLHGRDARLNCIVRTLENNTVSWIRQADLHILTIGRYTYTTDLRFGAEHEPGSAIWTLAIRGARHNDSGLYDCQISTKPLLTTTVNFTVIVPETRILGAGSLFIQRGSDLNLTCTVSYSPEPPDAVIWRLGDKVITFSSTRGGISVITEKGHRTTSHLLIQRAQSGDSGTYWCQPSNAAPASVTVHILDGEQSAAMQNGGVRTAAPERSVAAVSGTLLLLLLLTCCTAPAER
ncbi:netrin receptor DCC-like isoform X2 [Amphibalanus amphitrite]|nr:netrin receptor DCC-like isoform X2 [Amphibalanus amphitrite]XP_043221557.1 netrin receptor DCC-like isoform X2 [Amphibalanus amphitrite]